MIILVAEKSMDYQSFVYKLDNKITAITTETNLRKKLDLLMASGLLIKNYIKYDDIQQIYSYPSIHERLKALYSELEKVQNEVASTNDCEFLNNNHQILDFTKKLLTLENNQQHDKKQTSMVSSCLNFFRCSSPSQVLTQNNYYEDLSQLQNFSERIKPFLR